MAEQANQRRQSNKKGLERIAEANRRYNEFSSESVRMTRKVYEQQKESFNDAKQKLKLAFTSITELDREERNPKDHKDKLDVFSVAFAHYTTQAATYRV